MQFFVGDEVLVYWPLFYAFDTNAPRKHRFGYFVLYRVVEFPSLQVVVLPGLLSRIPTTVSIEYIHLYCRDRNPTRAALRAHAHPPPML